MSKTILVEWPGPFSRLGDPLFSNKQRTHSPECCKVSPTKKTFLPHACLHPAWATGSLPPACSSSCCWLGWAAQNAGNDVHKLLRVLFTLLRECLPTSPSTKKHMLHSCSSTHAFRGAAREFCGAAMDFFFKDCGASCIPDQEPGSLPEAPAHHAIANLQHLCIFSAYLWNFEEHALVTIFHC